MKKMLERIYLAKISEKRNYGVILWDVKELAFLKWTNSKLYWDIRL